MFIHDDLSKLKVKIIVKFFLENFNNNKIKFKTKFKKVPPIEQKIEN